MTRGVRIAPAAAAVAAVLLVAAPLIGNARRDPSRALLGATLPISPTSYLLEPGGRDRRYRLEAHPGLALLRRHQQPAVERPVEWRSYALGRWGQSLRRDLTLTWSPTSCSTMQGRASADPLLSLERLELAPPPLAFMTDADAPALDAALAEPSLLPVTLSGPCPWWKKPRPVTVTRHDSEGDTFALIDCDGAIAPEALDRLSVLARPHGTPRPELPLPPEPTGAEHGEWVPSVKLLHPRLLWVVASLGSAFPGRTIQVASGYRPDAQSTLHGRGRALDLAFRGVERERVYAECKKLKDVGCGYYPNHSFVHVDIRPHGTGHPTWIDVSNPGEPSRYVDAVPSIAPASEERG
jgi:hypothetical protein